MLTEIDQRRAEVLHLEAENTRLREQLALASSHIRTLAELQGDDAAIIARLREQFGLAISELRQIARNGNGAKRFAQIALDRLDAPAGEGRDEP